MCQPSRCSPKGGGVDTRRCASKNAGPKGGGGFGGGPTLIGGRKKCQRGRWAPKGGGLWCPTLVGEENKPPFIRAWKPSPNRRVLKPWGEARKEKPKEDNICSRGSGSLHLYNTPDTICFDPLTTSRNFSESPLFLLCSFTAHSPISRTCGSFGSHFDIRWLVQSN